MAKTAGGVRNNGRVRVSSGNRGNGSGAKSSGTRVFMGGTRNGAARMKSADEVKAQIERIQSYTHKSGVSPRRFFRAVGRVSNAIRQGERMQGGAPDYLTRKKKSRYQTNGYILNRK